MQKILLVAFLAASTLALPAYAQYKPAGSTAIAGGATQSQESAGITTAGSEGIDSTSTTDASGDSTLGLGGLLKQTQMQEESASQVEDGAGPAILSTGTNTGANTGTKVKTHTKVHAGH